MANPPRIYDNPGPADLNLLDVQQGLTRTESDTAGMEVVPSL